MAWGSFFKSSATKYGYLLGGIVFAAGAGGSAALSLRLASLCSSAVGFFIENIGTTISVSKLDGVIHFGKFSTNLTIEDIKAGIPEDWLEVINGTNKLPAYCFSVPFTLGLCLTTAISLALASAITTAIHIRHHEKAPPKEEDDPRTKLLINY